MAKKETVKIDDAYSYGEDDYNYILYKTEHREMIDIKTRQGTGVTKDVTTVVGYYGNISDMLDRYADCVGRDVFEKSQVATLAEYLQETIEQLKANFTAN